MLHDIRTPKGKLAGKVDKKTATFQIKDGAKTMLIQIPPDGLLIKLISGEGVAEEIYIPPINNTAI